MKASSGANSLKTRWRGAKLQSSFPVSYIPFREGVEFLCKPIDGACALAVVSGQSGGSKASTATRTRSRRTPSVGFVFRFQSILDKTFDGCFRPRSKSWSRGQQSVQHRFFSCSNIKVGTKETLYHCSRCSCSTFSIIFRQDTGGGGSTKAQGSPVRWFRSPCYSWSRH